MSINIAIINVGVNRKFFDKYHLLSPLFEDGSFEYVPVPEAAYPTCPGLPTYRELFSNKERVLQTIPEETRDLKVHYDPSLKHLLMEIIPITRKEREGQTSYWNWRNSTYSSSLPDSLKSKTENQRARQRRFLSVSLRLTK